MNSELKATIAQEGGKILSDLIRMFAARPRRFTPAEEAPATPPATTVAPAATITPEPAQFHPVRDVEKELDYRWECCMKHLGAAAVLLREAYERANDEGIGEGTGEKILEAMNEHAGMETDLEKMINIPEAKPVADKLLSGVRAFRAGAWKAKLPTGGGTKEDVADSRIWNDILLQEAYTNAKRHPGKECVAEGM